jgi:hypothetical protein
VSCVCRVRLGSKWDGKKALFVLAEPGGATLSGLGPFFERNLRWDRVTQSDHQMHHVM